MEAAFVVCLTAEEPSPFLDNVLGTCFLCGVRVQHRPYVAPDTPLTCLTCYEAMHATELAALVTLYAAR